MNAASFGVRKEKELALITRVKLAPEFKKPMSLRSFKSWTQCHTVTKSCPGVNFIIIYVRVFRRNFDVKAKT